MSTTLCVYCKMHAAVGLVRTTSVHGSPCCDECARLLGLKLVKKEDQVSE